MEASEEVELEETTLPVSTDVADITMNGLAEDEDDDDEDTSDVDAASDSLLKLGRVQMRGRGNHRENERTRPPSRCCVIVIVVVAVAVIVVLLAVSFAGSFGASSSAGNGKGDQLALTPPMGWNSWNKFHCNGLNEDLVKSIADALVDTGLAQAGYIYVNLDDCWQIDRDSGGSIMPDNSETRFKGGIKVLSDYVHSKGLKFGLYTDAGTLTCQRRPGSYGHERIDAETYASWGVDFIKNDDCYLYPTMDVVADYTRMWDSIVASNRPMIHSVKGSLYVEHAHKVAHMRRIGEDIHPEWDSMLGLVDQVVEESLWRFAMPGFWNDLDMLEIGNGGMTESESVAHMALWCALKAPLLLGNDIRKMSNFTRQLLTHDELLAVLNDPLGQSVQPVYTASALDGTASQQVVSKRCDTKDPSQAWRYDKSKKTLTNVETGKCLAIGWRDYIYIEDCDPESDTQSWTINFNTKQVHNTDDTCLTSVPTEAAGCKVRDCYIRQHLKDFQGANKPWMQFNDAFHMEVIAEDTYTFSNSKNLCPGIGGPQELQIFAGSLSNNRHVAVLLNRDKKPHNITLKWDYIPELGKDTECALRDVYLRHNLGTAKESFIQLVDAHSVLMLSLTPV